MIFNSRRAMASPILKDRMCFLLSTSKPVMVGELLSCFSELHPILYIILRSIGIGQRAICASWNDEFQFIGYL
jgi:hypothetical protein